MTSRKPGRRLRQEAMTAGVFILPAGVIITLCILVPILLAFLLSFTHCSRFLTIHWAGLYNYAKLFSDPLAFKSMANTLFYVVVYVPLNLALALGIALLLNRRFPGMKFIRSIYFVPVVLSIVVTVSIFRFLYDYNFGPVNTALGAVFETVGFSYEPIPWLEDKRFAMWSIIILMVWKTSAFFSIILLAALQDVPRELHEAAEVDGAGVMSRFWNVTIPTIAPVMTAVVALSGIGAFRVFIPMFVLTQGGPANSTRSMAQHAYQTGFNDGNLGESSAISFTLMAIIVVATLILNKVRKEEE